MNPLQRIFTCLALCASLSHVASANVIDVNQQNFGFVPQDITINVGDTVRWHWSAFNHNVTEGTDGLINGNEAFTFPLTSANPLVQFTFDAAFVAANPRPGGLYDYFCSIHFASAMVGTVTVNADPGTPFCFGDGSGTACPCANASPVGDKSGCLSSLGTGGKLTASGSPSVSADSIVLQGAAMPASSALFFQGSAQQSAGAGAIFGDGLRCAAGAVLRLGTKTGSTTPSYPGGGDLSVSIKGAVTSGDTRHYQAWYRNAATFCTSSTFNLTNGYTLVWGP